MISRDIKEIKRRIRNNIRKRLEKMRKFNNFCRVLRENNTRVLIESSELKVGDIIEVLANQRIPADLILLHTLDQNGTVFIKTDQLDGETDWKLR